MKRRGAYSARVNDKLLGLLTDEATERARLASVRWSWLVLALQVGVGGYDLEDAANRGRRRAADSRR